MKKPIVKKADLNSRVGKYFVARKKGLNKKEAQIYAGFPTPTQSSRIEATKTYQALEKTYYRDELLAKISLTELAQEHRKNILQDQDKGAKNKAIEMALNRIEPETNPDKEDDRMVVILKT